MIIRISPRYATADIMRLLINEYDFIDKHECKNNPSDKYYRPICYDIHLVSLSSHSYHFDLVSTTLTTTILKMAHIVIAFLTVHIDMHAQQVFYFKRTQICNSKISIAIKIENKSLKKENMVGTEKKNVTKTMRKHYYDEETKENKVEKDLFHRKKPSSKEEEGRKRRRTHAPSTNSSIEIAIDVNEIMKYMIISINEIILQDEKGNDNRKNITMKEICNDLIDNCVLSILIKFISQWFSRIY
ncbi:hypothetical protein X798_00765 [Onchocerca flexuosa]|uniref:Uncharacterized protein n=1 Tax=Onchocerca flexuosa TaxID=387005 RepID=A0A238C4E4_9BILA|nr:hypothetical protein X798_00765 [Onchocerca flexuosa]